MSAIDIIIGVIAILFVCVLIYKKYREVKYGECSGCSQCTKRKDNNCKSCPHNKK